MNDHSPTSNWATIVAGLHMRPGCDSVSILRLEAMVGGRLPSSYVRLLELSNGADGFIGDNSIVIYPAEDLIANPFPYGEFVPGYLFFAGDGGGGHVRFRSPGSVGRRVRDPRRRSGFGQGDPDQPEP